MLLYPKSKLIAWICFDAAFTILVLIAAGLRFFQQRTLRPLARSYIVGNITISLSTLCITAWTIISAMARVQYMRWEDNPVGYPPPWTREGHFLLWLAGYWYILCLWLIKLSFLSTYFRVVPHLRTWARKALYVTMAYIACTFVTCVLVHSFYCMPVHTNWTEGPKNCSPWLSVPSLSIMTAANVSSDIALLIIPLLVLRELRLRKGEVYAFAFIYLIGSASILASILRYAFIRVAYRDGLKYQAHNNSGGGGGGGSSSAYEAVYLSTDLDEKIKVWTTVEYCTASIAFCLPSLRNLLRRGGPGGGGGGLLRRRRVELHSTGSRRRSSREESTYVSVSTVKERRESQAELTLPTPPPPPQPVMVVTQR